jgi:ketosteroid isomerase-like protein
MATVGIAFAGTNARAADATAGGTEVVREFFAALETMDIERFLKIWDERGVQIMPFAPAGFPQRLEGRAAIRQQYEGLPKNFASMKFPDLQIYRTADPAVVWATWRGEIPIEATGKPYNNRYAGLFKLRDGRVIEFHEYFNPLILLEAFGDAESLQRNYNVKPETR